MTGLLARAASLVVEPRTPTDAPPATAPAASRALVLGSPATAPPVAAALAGSLRAQDRAPAALLCVWSPAAPDAQLPPPGPAPSFAAPVAAPGAAAAPPPPAPSLPPPPRGGARPPPSAAPLPPARGRGRPAPPPRPPGGGAPGRVGVRRRAAPRRSPLRPRPGGPS